MSPRPNMAKLFASKPFSSKSCGKTTKIMRISQITVSMNDFRICDSSIHLIGASNDLATVTMTLVPNTQKMS